MVDGTQSILKGRYSELHLLCKATRHFGRKQVESSISRAAGLTGKRAGPDGHGVGIEVFVSRWQRLPRSLRVSYVV